jgi:hypothetical protein
MRWWAPMVIAFVLAGCISESSDKTFTVPDDAPRSEDAYTGDGYDLAVQVVDIDGNPISNAAVVYFTGGTSGSASASADFECNGNACTGGSVFWATDVGSYDTVAGVRTGANGTVVVDVKPNAGIHVAAGDVEGMTTELLADVTAGRGGSGGQVTIVLYPATIEHRFTVIMANDAGRAGAMQGSYSSFPMAFSDIDTRHAAYEARIWGLQTSIAWTNGPSSAADLYVGVGSAEGPQFTGEDRENITPGTHSETLQLSPGELDGQRADLVSSGYHVQTMTDWVSLGFNGVPVDVTVTADLKGSNIIIR